MTIAMDAGSDLLEYRSNIIIEGSMLSLSNAWFSLRPRQTDNPRRAPP
jgi:hypothetical protein